jgi:epoxide hydrolase-like predicted phosphatase
VASENGRRTGLLIDWGGVLTTNLFEAFRAFCEAHGLEPDAVTSKFRSDRASRELLIAFETGAVDELEFEERFGAQLGLAPEGLIDGLFAGSRPDEAMIAAVRAARAAGVRTGLVSNSWGTRRYPRRLLAELFVGVVISGEEGMRKPAVEMYTLGAERIGLPPSECVYVDDLAVNLEPARELGMATIHHVEASATIAELGRLLGVSLGSRS